MSTRRMRIGWHLRSVRPTLRKPVVLLRHRGLRPTDAFLAHFPKSGNTWLAFMLGEVLFDRSIDWENEGRYLPPVGQQNQAPETLPGSGRLLRTYEPYRSEYSGKKAVYLVRHVGDVAVSYFNWLQWWTKVEFDFETFLRHFFEGRIDAHGAWQNHVESWLTAKESDRLIVRYEDLRRSPESELTRVLGHLGMSSQPDRVQRAVENNTVENMRAKEDAVRETVFQGRNEQRRFVRKAAIGDSKEWLSDSALKLLERYAGNTLSQLGYDGQV